MTKFPYLITLWSVLVLNQEQKHDTNIKKGPKFIHSLSYSFSYLSHLIVFLLFFIWSQLLLPSPMNPSQSRWRRRRRMTRSCCHGQAPLTPGSPYRIRHVLAFRECMGTIPAWLVVEGTAAVPVVRTALDADVAVGDAPFIDRPEKSISSSCGHVP